MHWLKTLAFLFIPVAFVACQPSQEDIANGDDPIAALGSTVESSRYGATYWAEQMKADSDVWNDAVAYCEDAERANYPNCELVAAAKFMATPDAVENPFQSEEGLNP